MPISKHIEKLRSLPDNTKRQVSFLYALGLTGIIVIIWFVNLGVSWSQLGKEAVAANEPESPVKMMWSSVESNFARVRSGASEVGAVIQAVQKNFEQQ